MNRISNHIRDIVVQISQLYYFAISSTGWFWFIMNYFFQFPLHKVTISVCCENINFQPWQSRETKAAFINVIVTSQKII